MDDSGFAVEGLTEALAAELAPLGIHATVVEPASSARTSSTTNPSCGLRE